MKYIFLFLFAGLWQFSDAQHLDHAQVETVAVKPKSPKMSVMEYIGKNHVHIDYSSPSVRGRNIWNGLVAFDQVWVTGAHNATSIEFGQDVVINGKIINKGKYGFFTIPNKDVWILILSKDYKMHLADEYNPENDVLRLKVSPEYGKELTEALTYTIESLGDGIGRINVSWEYITVSMDFQNIEK